METENLVIIGSGPAGLTAAIYASRANLNPVILEGTNPGGQLMNTTYVENWPGEKRILGPKLILNMKEHAKSLGTKFISQELVQIDLKARPFNLITNKDLKLRSKAIVIATGATPKRLGIKGETKYWGRGVTTCAVCDGAFYKNKPVVIVGGGDSAMENASFMKNFTDKITIVQIHPELTASYAMQQRVLKNKNINIIYNSTVTKISGTDENVNHVTVTNQLDGKETTLDANAVFIAIGLKPNTKVFKDQLELDDYGYIVLKKHTQTSIPGVFASGDVVDKRYRQAITSAGSGCAASLDAERYLNNL